MRGADRWQSLAAALLRREERGVLGPRRQHMLRALRRNVEQAKEQVVLHAQGRRTREKASVAGEDTRVTVCGVAAKPRRQFVHEDKEQHGVRLAHIPQLLDATCRWSRLVEGLLRNSGRLVNLATSTRVNMARCCKVDMRPASPSSLWQAQVHDYVRGMASTQGFGNSIERPPLELLTLGNSERSLELLQVRRAVVLRVRRWRRKWMNWIAIRLLKRVLAPWRAAVTPRERFAFPPCMAIPPPRNTRRFHVRSAVPPGAGARAPQVFRDAPEASSPAVRTSSGDRDGPAHGSAEEASLAEELGLDVETFRMLRQLEEREIVPEDYDVLLRLDEAVAPKTLAPPQLRRFPTEVYAGRTGVTLADEVLVAPAALVRGPTAFGVDFWRLHVPQFGDEASADGAPAACEGPVRGRVDFGADFWRLPMSLEDEAELSVCFGTPRSSVSTASVFTPRSSDGASSQHSSLGQVDAGTEALIEVNASADVGELAEAAPVAAASAEPAETCMVCYMEFEEGDRVRRLQPCGHLFHKACIDSWLLGSSTRCPIDNLEVCVS